MKKYLMALALALAPLLSGCFAMSLFTPLRGGTICLTPEFDAGYSTQAVVSKYSRANINHLQLDLYSGVTLISSKDILNVALGNTVTISNLKTGTTYTIKAAAYKAAGVAAADLISIPADSQVQVTVAFDDRPTLAGIPVKLIDTPFGGQATGSIAVTPSANYTTPATESFPFIISKIAGDGTAAYGGDGLAATSAQLNLPNAVACDSAGYLYIADTDNNRIRKVTSGGIISTVAGTGVAGGGGDTGLATNAQLKAPNGVACDSSGNLYIADTNNQRIRKVNKADGIITTVAGTGTAGYNVAEDGGAATSAQLYNPYAVALDSAGNLYIADGHNNRIRKVDKDTQVITTVAGNGIQGSGGDNGAATSASLNRPWALVLDSADNLYIADTHNNRIRKVDKDTQVITAFAGDGTASYGGDGGAATSAKLNCPYGVTYDSAGNLYIADTNNNRIRKVTSGGIISTVAGDGAYAYGGDGGLAIAAKLKDPCGLAFDSAGSLYIADYSNNRIRILY